MKIMIVKFCSKKELSLFLVYCIVKAMKKMKSFINIFLITWIKDL